MVENKNQKNIATETSNETIVFDIVDSETHHDESGYSVLIEELSPDYKINRSHLYEITDISVVSRLNEVVRLGVPSVSQGFQIMKIKDIFNKTQTFIRYFSIIQSILKRRFFLKMD